MGIKFIKLLFSRRKIEWGYQHEDFTMTPLESRQVRLKNKILTVVSRLIPNAS
jgi:hypothetical protein